MALQAKITTFVAQLMYDHWTLQGDPKDRWLDALRSCHSFLCFDHGFSFLSSRQGLATVAFFGIEPPGPIIYGRETWDMFSLNG
jgi:hypothetical protein